MSAYIGEASWDGERSYVFHDEAGREANYHQGRVIVTLDVDDGEFDLVELSKTDLTSHITALTQAIDALEAVREGLLTMYGDDAPIGRCTATGDWGRCKAREDHEDGEHVFPTEDQYRAESQRLVELRGKRSA